MPIEPDSWERVAAELRARRAAQRQAWGDLDNITLGRYLADESGPEERARVERALAERPELRALTAVVRDVLAEFEPEVVPVPPPVLPFRRPAAPFRPARRRPEAALLAVAALLLAVGLSLSPTLRGRPDAPDAAAPDDALALRSRPWQASYAFVPVDLQVAQLEQQGQLDEARALVDAKYPAVARAARLDNDPRFGDRYADRLNRLASEYEKRGELAKAGPVLMRAHAICEMHNLPPENRTRRQTLRALAGVYQVALNAPAAEPEAGADTEAAPLPRAVAPRGGEAPPAPAIAVRMKPAEPASVSAGRAVDAAYFLREQITRRPSAEVQKSVLPVLEQALREARTPTERQAYARAIGQLGPAAAGAAPLLAETFRKADDPGERRAVLLALGRMGPAARDAARAVAAPDVAKAADEKQLALEVLRRVDGPAARVGVRDECGCFSPYAVQQGHHTIATLARRYGIEVYTESRPAPPTDGKERALAAGNNGLYLLITKDPPSAEVVVSEGLRKRGFTPQDDARLRQLVREHAARKDYDGCLLAGVRYIAQVEQKGRAVTPSVAPASRPVSRQLLGAAAGAAGVAGR